MMKNAITEYNTMILQCLFNDFSTSYLNNISAFFTATFNLTKHKNLNSNERSQDLDLKCRKRCKVMKDEKLKMKKKLPY